MKIKYRATWRNTIKKEKTQPLKYFLPESLQDIQTIINEAEPLKIKVRAVGSGHSFSNVAITEGYLVDLKMLNKICELREEWLKDIDASCLVNVEAGTTIQKFNKLMEKRNLCVVNMGGIDNQTLAGAISTGTHGSGLELPAFHGMVKSIVMVSGGGKAYRIEPTDGITDPAKYNEPGVTLRQDDDLFNTVLVGVGCAGIVYSYILQLEPMYWLKESKELCYWNQVKPMLADRSLFEEDEQGHQKYRVIMVQVSPYIDKTGDRMCIIVRHQQLDEVEKRKYQDRYRNIFSRLGGFPIFYWFAVLTVRYIPKSIPKLIDNALRGLKDKSYVNKGYKVLYQGAEYVKIRAYDCEFAFDMKDNSFLDALEEVMDKAKDLEDNNIMFQTSPYGMRFVKGGAAYLCPDHDKTVCYIDMPFLRNTIGADEILNQYQDIIMRKEQGVPHWGKIHNRIFRYPALIAKFYPKLDHWLNIIDQLDPKETFSNDFLYELKLVNNIIKEANENQKAIVRF